MLALEFIPVFIVSYTVILICMLHSYLVIIDNEFN